MRAMSERKIQQSRLKSRNGNRLERQLELVILLSPFLFGLWFPWASALVSIWLSVLLIMERNRLRLSKSLFQLWSICMVLCLLLGAVWGIDRGMAIVGAVQFLPLPLFVLALEQTAPDSRPMLQRKMPSAAAGMVLLSLLLGMIPTVSHWFWVNGRLAGFFQYPNTFAVYLLLALLRLWENGMGGRKEYGTAVLLLFGIGLAGSRTVWLILLAVLLMLALREKRKETRRALFLLDGLLLAAGICYVLLCGRLSLSTIYGRLLYARDAVPVILRHPLGLGYLGYSWLQGSFQTGVYSTTHVHNELLQLLLDCGWIPGFLLAAALLRSFRRTGRSFIQKLMPAVLCLHCLLDFDTQFVSVGLLLVAMADRESAEIRPEKPSRILLPAVAAASTLSFWIGTASFFLYIGEAETAAGLYPGYTSALVKLLPEAEGEKQELLSEQILKLNGSAVSAHDVRAEAAFARGDFASAEEEKREAIRLAKYSLPEYLDWLDLLQKEYERCRSRGDLSGAEACAQRMRDVPVLLREVEENTSALGWKIQDQPNLELPARYRQMIAEKGHF